MKYQFSRRKLTLSIGLAFLLISAVATYAAIFPVILGNGTNADAPLVSGPATVTFRQLTTTPGDVGAWHYHPGYVHSVVTSGAIKIEDGCGGAQTYSTGQAFETSEGRVHRAINEGTVDARDSFPKINAAVVRRAMLRNAKTMDGRSSTFRRPSLTRASVSSSCCNVPGLICSCRRIHWSRASTVLRRTGKP